MEAWRLVERSRCTSARSFCFAEGPAVGPMISQTLKPLMFFRSQRSQPRRNGPTRVDKIIDCGIGGSRLARSTNVSAIGITNLAKARCRAQGSRSRSQNGNRRELERSGTIADQSA